MSGQQMGSMAPGRLSRALLAPMAALALLVPAVPAPTQDVVAAEAAQLPLESIDARWLPWIGCWRLVFQSAAAPDESGEDTLLCLGPSDDGRSVVLTTLAQGESFFRHTLHADGEPRPFEEWGCRGRRSAQWSRDGRRLFTSSQSRCEGQDRSASGVSAIVPGKGWLDIQAVGSGELRHIWVRQYRAASVDEAREAGYPSLPEPYRASAAARRIAAERLSIEDVVEAFEETDASVVEALLLERGAGFELDGAALRGLAEAEAPPHVIDLMVALSFPQRFTVERFKRERAEQAAAARTSRSGYPRASVNTLGGAWVGSGYWYPFYFAPYSYWPRYGVLLPSPSIEERGARVVAGRGYTRVTPVRRPSAASRRAGSGGGYSGSSSGGGGTVSSGGYSGGGGSSSSGRTAKPRDNDR